MLSMRNKVFHRDFASIAKNFERNYTAVSSHRVLSIDSSQKKHRNDRWHSSESASAHKSSVRSAFWKISIALGAGVALGAAAWYERRYASCQATTSPPPIQAGAPRKDLPTFRLKEVQSHNSKEAGIWVTYKDGIYDITDFMIGHPGGDKILLAAGSSVEPFWDLYAIHRSPEVYEILETLRIGNLHPEDKVARPAVNPNDPYKHDPARHPALKVNSAKPFNAEAPGSLLADNFITPNDLFFVRNHLPVPKVDPKKFRLQVGGKQFALQDLKQKFKQHSVIATVQCAGNRRSELSKVKAVNGLSWSHAAISNAEWTGVLLSDLLTSAGINGEDYKHCILQGLDTDGEGNPYEASIPMETASDPKKEAIVAFEMNGQELPLDHGFPLRVIVPGTVGARQVKWVKMIGASQEESYSHWQRKDYKLFSPSTGHDTADYDKAVAIQEYPTQSAICEPRNGATIEGSEVTLRGYAWSGGGRGIMRVEVTPDGGKTWYEAEMHGDEQQKRHQQWAWVLWEVAVPVPDGASDMSIACRAIDSSHNSQPEKLESVWNIRGLINNAWHHINLKVDNED